MRFRLRTLLILLAIGPPMLAAIYWWPYLPGPMLAVIAAWIDFRRSAQPKSQ